MPFLEVQESASFRAWLIKTLEPICEADPDVMADYVLALLKHEAPEDGLKKFFVKELVDFLEDKTAEFVELLFRTLQNKSYDTAVAPKPIVTDSFQPSAPAKRRLSSASAGPGPSSKAARRSLSPSKKSAVEVDGGFGEIGPSGKRKCSDYHERGFCARGVNCPFEHSPDSIYPVPGQDFPVPFPMGMPMMPPFPGRGRGFNRGRGFGGRGMPFPPRGFGPGHMPMPMPMPNPDGSMPPFDPTMMPMQMQMGNGYGRPPRMQRDENDVQFPPGTSGTQRQPEGRNGVTLLVSDIPHPSLSLETIVNHFKKFGVVTNVAIEARSKRALVSFSSNYEAYLAWRSDETLFGSRHVKVLWHKPMEGYEAAGLEALKKSAPMLENLRRIEAEGAAAAQGDVKAVLIGPKQIKKQQKQKEKDLKRRSKLERLIAEQKVLLVKVEKEKSKDERKAMIARCKEIEAEMQRVKDAPDVESEEEAEAEPVMDVEMAEAVEPTAKEKFDAELAALGMQTADDENEVLRRKLAELKKQASAMGIDADAPPSPYPARGAWRGRARGRGGRGRGTFGSATMRLDNRSRVVEVSGEGLAENKSVVQQWYESTGGEVAEAGGSLTVSYPSRELAEKALALGTKIPSVTTPVTVKWSIATAPQIGATAAEPVQEREERRERDVDDE